MCRDFSKFCLMFNGFFSGIQMQFTEKEKTFNQETEFWDVYAHAGKIWAHLNENVSSYLITKLYKIFKHLLYLEYKIKKKNSISRIPNLKKYLYFEYQIFLKHLYLEYQIFLKHLQYLEYKFFWNTFYISNITFFETPSISRIPIFSKQLLSLEYQNFFGTPISRISI